MVDPAAVTRSVLDNGVIFLSERIPTVRSASIGIWVNRGSRDESAGHSGIAHFVEHMLFKGTSSRSARDIAIAIDAMGGQLDAFTSKENACYYAQVLDEHVDDAIALLGDLVRDPRFDPGELERERGVILEEIASVEDSPEDVLYESFAARLYADHSLGRPILGTRETVSALSATDLREYFTSIGGGDLVVAVAGNVDHAEIERLVQRDFAAPRPGSERVARRVPAAQQHFQAIAREELEQVQLYVAAAAPSRADPRRYAAHVLNAVLGGSVSSRLFQKVREEQGLAYSIYSSLGGFSDTGYAWISAGTKAEAAIRVFDIVLEELRSLATEGVEDDELQRMKDHLKGGLMLSLENTFGRMCNLARQEILFGRQFGFDEILGSIDAVSAVQLRDLAAEIWSDDRVSLGLIARRDAAASIGDEVTGRVRLPGGSPIPALAGSSGPAT